MARKIGLGRGLDALLPGGDIEDFSYEGETKTKEQIVKKDSVLQIPVEKLIPNPGQPRKNFDEAELKELSDSIAEHGIIQPILAEEDKNGSFIIIAGERRARAAKLAGLKEVPAIINKYSGRGRLEISLIENIQRSGLNPIEEASAYKNLMDFSNLSQEELSARVGKNRSTVANSLRLLKLPAEMQKSIETGEKNGGISSGHARALLSVNDKKLRVNLFKEITDKKLSVREAEKRALAMNSAPVTGEDAKEIKASNRPPEIKEMEEKFIEVLGTKVIIEGGLDKGRIRIDYYSMDDLDRLYGILIKQKEY